MAERRMFTKKITDSDSFLDMPASSQMLYFHLNMNADDDGFVNNPRKIQRMCGASDDDMKLLLMKSFIIAFESGVIVIKHWKMHNYIQSDRYKPTDYAEEMSMLSVKKNKAYTLVETEMYPECIQTVSVGKVSIGKDSIDKEREGKDSIEKNKNHRERYFPLDDDLEEAFQAFIEMRKKLKKPLTDRAIKLQIKKLTELANTPFHDSMAMDNELAIKIIDQSIEHGWLSFYPLKNGDGTNSKKSVFDEWKDA